jgi:hypothetical protein
MAEAKLPPIQQTISEVFIIESLSIEDERLKVTEGKILFDTLKMCGKSPEYYYIRTKRELEEVAKIFRKSGCRYLHISCHADEANICLTYDDLSYMEFAEIFRGYLKNRRLFVSACSVGVSEMFASIVAGKDNQGMYSVVAPQIDIRFDKAVALWCAFYVQVFSEKVNSMNQTRIRYALMALCRLFDVPIMFSMYSANTNSWGHDVIKGRSQINKGGDNILKKAKLLK